MIPREEVAKRLEGTDPEDVAMVLLEGLEILLQNDPLFFSGGRGRSLAHTLGLIKSLVEEAIV